MAFAKNSGTFTGKFSLPSGISSSIKILDFYQHKEIGEKISIEGKNDRALLMICWMEIDNICDVDQVSATFKSALEIHG